MKFCDFANAHPPNPYYNGSTRPSPDPNNGKNFGTQIGKRVVLRKLEAPIGWTVEWRDVYTNKTYPADGKTVLVNGDPRVPEKQYNLVPVWTRLEYKIMYNINYPYQFDGTMSYAGLGTCKYSDDKGRCSQVQICYMDEPCVLKSPDLLATGYRIKDPADSTPAKWCVGTTDNFNGTCNGKSLNFGATLAPSDFTIFDADKKVTLRAQWKLFNETYKIVLKWRPSLWKDLDSWICGSKISGDIFCSGYSSKVYSEPINGMTINIASLDRDCTGGCDDAGKSGGYYYQTETFILNTLGGRDYEYYVANYSIADSINDSKATVTLYKLNDKTGKYKTVKTYKSNKATGEGRVWNVFTYQNGQIVDRNIRRWSADATSTALLNIYRRYH